MSEETPFGIYAAYDVAIHNFMRDLVLPIEPTSIIIQASPQRAFGDAAAMMAKGMAGRPELSDDLNRSANIPLPLISILPGAPMKREKGRQLPARNLFRQSLPGTDESLRERWVSKPPVPVWITYQVEIWTKTRSTMNALITAVQQKFDPYMAWGQVQIDDWFWGSMWMAIHLDSMQDNSELEAADKDRLLRHTLSLKVEGWCFNPPEKDLTALKFTIDETVSHLDQKIIRLNQLRFGSLYFETNASRIYRVCITNAGKISIIPTNAPPDPVTHYFGQDIVVFEDGLILDEATPTGTANWLMTFNGHIVGEKLSVSRIQSNAERLPSLFIPRQQKLWIGYNVGSKGRGYLLGSDSYADTATTFTGRYIEVYLHRMLGLSYHERFLLLSNIAPVVPPLPFSTLLPE